MINVNCVKCMKELTQPGALIFGYPISGEDLVPKYHVCRSCWHGSLLNWMDTPPEDESFTEEQKPKTKTQ